MTPEQRSQHMAKIRSKDTKPELRVRRTLHREGYRYLVHDKRLPGSPDLVFPSRRKAIFVHGCFWHAHDCPVGLRLPKSNPDFWAEKRARNQERDREQVLNLMEQGWNVLIIWECQTKDSEVILAIAQNFLED